ncbi:MAG: hypothetical protein LBT88_06590 [Oscillospiraceae bacterium]|jgi:hypothetical protein|nr:hypothetical protein [Oscillospiraceae bacterium]
MNILGFIAAVFGSACAVLAVVAPLMIGNRKAHKAQHNDADDKLNEIVKSIKSVSESLELAIVNDIETAFNKYSARGYCPPQAKRAVSRLYDECALRGWNGDVRYMCDSLMRMPDARGGKKGECADERCDAATS